MKRILIFSLVLVLAGLSYTAVLAQEDVELPACPDGEVSGTITAYDEETGLVTLDVEGELCTVALSDEFDHPIVDLLAAYFGELNVDEITEALDALQVCVLIEGETTTVSQPEEDGTCAEGELVTVTGQSEEGGFEGQNEEGDPISFDLEDEEAAGALSDALDSLQADLTIEEGAASDVGEDIAQYHDDGIGFGVLVKVYAIFEEAQTACGEAGEEVPAEEGEVTEGAVDEEVGEEVDPCDVSVDSLLEELNGKGLGQLFQVYGKPAIMGIGHVRNIGEDAADDASSTGNGSNGANGICNARSHGGNANAKGQPDVVCDETEGGSGEDAGDPEVIEGDG